MKLGLCILVSFYSAIARADHDTSATSAFAAAPLSGTLVGVIEAIKDDLPFQAALQATVEEGAKLQLLKGRFPLATEAELNQVIASLSIESAQQVEIPEDDVFPAPMPADPPSNFEPPPNGEFVNQGPGQQQDVPNFENANTGGPTVAAPGLGTGPDPGPEQGQQAGKDPRRNGQGQAQANDPQRGGMMGGGIPQDPMSRLAMLAGMAQGFGGQGGGGGGPPPPLETPKIQPYRPGAPYVQPTPPPEVVLSPALAQSLAFQGENPEQREARANNFNEFLRNYAQGQTAFLQQVAQQGALYLQNIQMGAAALSGNAVSYPSVGANFASRVQSSTVARGRQPAGLSQGLNLSRGVTGPAPARMLLRPRQRYLR